MPGRPLSAVILAAGESRLAHSPHRMVMEPLGAHWIVDYVVDHVAPLVLPEATFVVVGPDATELRAHLGPRFCYVEQAAPLGTGDAVLRTHPQLADFAGDLLVVYGDTPLLRAASLRGLITRHRHSGADLTLLSAVVRQALPYARVVRDGRGVLVDLVEEIDASAPVREIHELNVGAYVLPAPRLWPVLQQLGPCAADHPLRLTDAVRALIAAGARAEAYQVVDEDEVLGINEADDLRRAELILKQRAFQPRRDRDPFRLSFGTGGWRAMIGEGFTLPNVRRLSQALANLAVRQRWERRGVVIGFDRRFLSDAAAEAAAEVFAGNNVRVLLLPEPAPTPLVTFATAATEAALGLVVTASHNPPVDNGIKLFHADGSLWLSDETRALEDEANALVATDVVDIPLATALRAGVVRREDLSGPYLDAVEAQVDMNRIRRAGLRVAFDPMFGVGKVTVERLLTEARCSVTTIHGRHDPLFGGRSPAPDLEALGQLCGVVTEGGHDVGMATDGDADRIAIVDEAGRYVAVDDLLLLLYHHLHERRGLRGGVVRNLATTCRLDRLAAHLGERCVETPVGFKHIVAAMREHDALLGGESSGGLAVRGHILGKDGVLAAALVIELLATSGEKISALRDELRAVTGPMVAVEECLPATPEMRLLVSQRWQDRELTRIGGLAVTRVSRLDGTKLYLEGEASLLVRFSGTEPLLRLRAEAESREQAAALVAWCRGELERDLEAQPG